MTFPVGPVQKTSADAAARGHTVESRFSGPDCTDQRACSPASHNELERWMGEEREGGTRRTTKDEVSLGVGYVCSRVEGVRLFEARGQLAIRECDARAVREPSAMF